MTPEEPIEPVEQQFRVRRRSLVIGDKVYNRGDILLASQLGKLIPMLISNQLISRVLQEGTLEVPAKVGLWARIRGLFGGKPT
ncbi:MAG: hypothetical protein ACAH95_01395 [Fimbriimonas sp.]